MKHQFLSVDHQEGCEEGGPAAVPWWQRNSKTGKLVPSHHYWSPPRKVLFQQFYWESYLLLQVYDIRILYLYATPSWKLLP